MRLLIERDEVKCYFNGLGYSGPVARVCIMLGWGCLPVACARASGWASLQCSIRHEAQFLERLGLLLVSEEFARECLRELRAGVT